MGSESVEAAGITTGHTALERSGPSEVEAPVENDAADVGFLVTTDSWQLHTSETCWREKESGIVYCNVTETNWSLWKDPDTLALWSYHTKTGAWCWGWVEHEEYGEILSGVVPS